MQTHIDEEATLSKLGLDFHVLDSGCCGMAGAFGFEKEHYDVSLKVGERVLLPAVRKAEEDTFIIADGFSCREQIEQTTNRYALHLAQVLQMTLHKQQNNNMDDIEGRPEDQAMQLTSRPLLMSHPTTRVALLH